jgi:hypothetical protein
MIEENKAILDNLLILYILTFIGPTFPNSVELLFLYDSKEEYIKKKELYNIYFNFCNCNKLFYQLFNDNSYFIFNKKYSEYIYSKKFQDELNKKKINNRNLLIYGHNNNLIKYSNIRKEKVRLFHILRKIYTYKEVLAFMKLDNTETTKITLYELLNSIHEFVYEQKSARNPDIFVIGDKTRFRLIGDLKILFDFIKKQIIKRNKLEDLEIFNEDIIRYIDLPEYCKYCVREKIFNLI